MISEELIQRAKEIVYPHDISEGVCTGKVGCALMTEAGNVYCGVSIDANCGIGFCAEHSAIAEMVMNQEYIVKKIVAICNDGTILPPCGRCRELMYQIDEKNLDADVILKNKVVKLKDLLPESWRKGWD